MTEDDWLRMIYHNRDLGVRVGFAVGFLAGTGLAGVVWLMS